jgi:hypothetical protein
MPFETNSDYAALEHPTVGSGVHLKYKNANKSEYRLHVNVTHAHGDFFAGTVLAVFAWEQKSLITGGAMHDRFVSKTVEFERRHVFGISRNP